MTNEITHICLARTTKCNMRAIITLILCTSCFFSAHAFTIEEAENQANEETASVAETSATATPQHKF